MRQPKARCIRTTSFAFLLFLFATSCFAQGGMFVSLAALDGMELTPDNIFNFQIVNNTGSAKEVTLKGLVKYKNSPLSISYTVNARAHSGTNIISADQITNPAWSFSSPAFRELFFTCKKLPQGTYEYCVELATKSTGGDAPDAIPENDCIYQRVDDIFLINLIDPDNNAKLHEYHPMFSWVVNYPFASELSYRIRVAELKTGQSNENAIARNNAVYQDNHVLSTSTTYPLTAKPLEPWQPYVWTVDAYFKGILLGGAEVWKFTIIEDSLLASVPRNSSHVDIRREKGGTPLYAVGELKIKYVLEESRSDQLELILTDKNNSEIKLPSAKLSADYGDNRFEIKMHNEINLKHLKTYTLTVRNRGGEQFILPFTYINPDFL